ncbi:MAG: glycosyltransferase family 4 protein [Bacteriovoracaceae bacterium]|nr:glycosyltransferase family 4 protein [Bacteriovoracaceae bacterium]
MINIVLYSEENFVWTSMQEIIPGLLKCWKEVGVRENIETIVINVDDQKSLKNNIAKIISCENIVLTSYNAKIAKAVVLIRSSLGVDARMIVHLHGLASVGCWPLHEFKTGELLTERDVFLSSSQRDADTFKLSFENARCEVIKFHQTYEKPAPVVKTPSLAKFVYVGRIAEQKNLHQLLWAISLVRRKKPELKFELDIYGEPDNLGSPNMNIPSKDYKEFLEKIINDLKINNVNFKGFVKRENLDTWVSENRHIFISPSLHSDENFGMAALKSLEAGNCAILTDWGGHTDFNKSFSDAVSLINVYSSQLGPVIDPIELSEAIIMNIETFPRDVVKSEAYKFDNIVRNYCEFIRKEKNDSIKPLVQTKLSKRVHKARNELIGEKGCQCFTGYDDPNSIPFFSSYGMSERKIERSASSGEKAPWVTGKEFSDPHKGLIKLNSEDEYIQNGFMI